ncbi:hypothetical protein ACWGH3_32475 [Streptomyces sp. NPDC054884]
MFQFTARTTFTGALPRQLALPLRRYRPRAPPPHTTRCSRAIRRSDTENVTDRAAALLRDRCLRGHKYAVDAVLATVARSAPGPVTVLTSDPEDIGLLCGPAVEVVKV